MIAFFFTMPISRMIPINATTPRSLCVINSARIAPTPAEGSVERIERGLRARPRANKKILQRSWLQAITRLHFQNDVILVQLREYCRDLPLPERIVERVVDHLRRDPQPRRGVPIDRQRSFQAPV